MGYYVIRLSSGEQADVRWGMIFSKRLSLNPFRKRKPIDPKRGYIVRVGGSGEIPAGAGEAASGSGYREYRLLRSLDGRWLDEGDKGFPPAQKDATTLELKAAILQYENQH
jgi:hypothetical protein